MKLTKLLLLLSIILILSFQGYSQTFTGFTYNTAFTTSDTKDYIWSPSWRGFGFEARRFVQPNLSVGLSLSWNVLDQQTTRTISLEKGDITGKQFRYLNSFPLMLNAHYYWGEEFGFRPYLGINAGTYYTIQRVELGLVAFEAKNWHLGLAPEIGAVIPIGYSTNIILNARYNYAFKAGESVTKEKISYSYLGVNIGFVYTSDF